jgi:hypothetical protein
MGLVHDFFEYLALRALDIDLLLPIGETLAGTPDQAATIHSVSFLDVPAYLLESLLNVQGSVTSSQIG